MGVSTLDAAVRKVKDAVDIVVLISSYIDLQKRGNLNVGLCPFHGETTPSLTVYPDQHFHCFGCGKHGDAIDFLMGVENMFFRDAVATLAKGTAVALDREFIAPRKTVPTKQKRPQRPMAMAEVHAALVRVATDAHGAGDWLVQTWTYAGIDHEPALLVARADRTTPKTKFILRLHAVDGGWA